MRELLRRAFVAGMRAGDTEGLLSAEVIEAQWKLWAIKEGLL